MQVNFYLTPMDTSEVEAVIRNVEPMVILHSRSETSSPRKLQNLEFVEDGTQWLFFYLVRQVDLNAVVMRYVPAQNYWVIDELRSPVIEFNRSYFDNKILRRGRVYYVDAFYDERDVKVKKPEDFCKWAKEIFKATKKILKRKDSDYIGRHAELWAASSNGKLTAM